jgi:hypothetical protein
MLNGSGDATKLNQVNHGFSRKIVPKLTLYARGISIVSLAVRRKMICEAARASGGFCRDRSFRRASVGRVACDLERFPADAKTKDAMPVASLACTDVDRIGHPWSACGR